MNPRQSGIGKALAVIGALLQIPLLIDVFRMVAPMIRAFNRLAKDGVPDHAELSTALGHDLRATGVGLCIGLLGVVLLSIALVGSRYRAQWFFSFLVIYACGSLLLFPLGTGLGIFLLVYCIAHRRGFESGDGRTPNV